MTWVRAVLLYLLVILTPFHISYENPRVTLNCVQRNTWVMAYQTVNEEMCFIFCYHKLSANSVMQSVQYAGSKQMLKDYFNLLFIIIEQIVDSSSTSIFAIQCNVALHCGALSWWANLTPTSHTWTLYWILLYKGVIRGKLVVMGFFIFKVENQLLDVSGVIGGIKVCVRSVLAMRKECTKN